MINHLSGNPREFFDPDKPHRAICDTTTMEARVTDTMRLPVISRGFCHTGEHISFSARGHTGDRTLVEVTHQGFFVCEDQWAGSATVDADPTGGQDHDRGVVFNTELEANGWPVARTQIRGCGSCSRLDSPGDNWETVGTTL